MNECSKALPRRLRTPGFHRYFAGDGIDVGAGDDSLARQVAVWPTMRSVRGWDKSDGDATTLPGIEAGSFDFLHSSHCLEHLHDPQSALRRWCEVVKPGGYVVVMVPDAGMYEKGPKPNRFNLDHKHTFTLGDMIDASVNVLSLIQSIQHLADCLRVELLEDTYDPALPTSQDQTLSFGECAIEFVLRVTSEPS